VFYKTNLGQSASDAKDICDLFADFIERTYAEDVCTIGSGSELREWGRTFNSFQFTITEVKSALLDLDDRKCPNPNNVLPLVLNLSL
jgi:hypothetical protein